MKKNKPNKPNVFRQMTVEELVLKAFDALKEGKKESLFRLEWYMFDKNGVKLMDDGNNDHLPYI